MNPLELALKIYPFVSARHKPIFIGLLDGTTTDYQLVRLAKWYKRHRDENKYLYMAIESLCYSIEGAKYCCSQHGWRGYTQLFMEDAIDAFKTFIKNEAHKQFPHMLAHHFASATTQRIIIGAFSDADALMNLAKVSAYMLDRMIIEDDSLLYMSLTAYVEALLKKDEDGTPSETLMKLAYSLLRMYESDDGIQIMVFHA